MVLARSVCCRLELKKVFGGNTGQPQGHVRLTQNALLPAGASLSQSASVARTSASEQAMGFKWRPLTIRVRSVHQFMNITTTISNTDTPEEADSPRSSRTGWGDEKHIGLGLFTRINSAAGWLPGGPHPSLFERGGNANSTRSDQCSGWASSRRGRRHRCRRSAPAPCHSTAATGGTTTTDRREDAAMFLRKLVSTHGRRNASPLASSDGSRPASANRESAQRSGARGDPATRPRVGLRRSAV